jgi:hypothetical protein
MEHCLLWTTGITARKNFLSAAPCVVLQQDACDVLAPGGLNGAGMAQAAPRLSIKSHPRNDSARIIPRAFQSKVILLCAFCSPSRCCYSLSCLPRVRGEVEVLQRELINRLRPPLEHWLGAPKRHWFTYEAGMLASPLPAQRRQSIR